MLFRSRGFSDYGVNIRIGAPNGTTTNEIDAAFLYRNTLHLIECKAANIPSGPNSRESKTITRKFKTAAIKRTKNVKVIERIMLDFDKLNSIARKLRAC